MAGIAGFALCLLLLSAGLTCLAHLGQYGPEGHFAATQWPRFSSTPAVHVQGSFFWVSAVLAVFPLIVTRPVMFDIMAGMDQQNTFSVGWFSR